jgi:GNAT superfamily N-acetyltransferase
LDGGLYELLNWPIYHVHLARVGDAVVGYTSVVLYPDGIADDRGTSVLPDYRRQGIASKLRATQARDLLLMGWHALYAGAPLDEAAQGCAVAHFGPAVGSLDAAGDQMTYHGDRTAGVTMRLLEHGVPAPYPLSPANEGKLQRKAEAAHAHLAHLAVEGTLTMQKAALRG